MYFQESTTERIRFIFGSEPKTLSFPFWDFVQSRNRSACRLKISRIDVYVSV